MVEAKKAIICYLSYSGNTEEIAEIIEMALIEDNVDIDKHEIGIDPPDNLEKYDFICIGTFTWDYSSMPDDVKDFVLDIGYKRVNHGVFGSGDTQFGGDELFCRAVDRLTKFYESPVPVLKIEQSPRGSQERLVKSWLEGVLNNVAYIA